MTRKTRYINVLLSPFGTENSYTMQSYMDRCRAVTFKASENSATWMEKNEACGGCEFRFTCWTSQWIKHENS